MGEDLAELDVIAPVTRRLRFGGRELEISPLTMQQLPSVVRALQGVDFSAGLDATALPALFLRHSEALVAATAAATGIAREDIEREPIDEVARLIMAVYLVNDDFFARRVIPAVTSQITMPGHPDGAGQTPSSS